MPGVRAKFIVNRIERSMFGESEMATVVLAPVYSDKEGSENKTFWQYTPSGEIKLGTINAEAAKYFHLGDEYYIDFTRAEKAMAAGAGVEPADQAGD